MKKTLHLLLLTLAMLCAVNVNAATQNVTLQAGKNTINCTPGDKIVATYTTTKTDVIQIGCTSAGDLTYNGETKSFVYMPTSLSGAYRYKFDMEAGKTITLSIETLNTVETIYVTEGKVALQVETIVPKDNQIFTWSMQGEVSVSFNKPVTASNAVVRYKGVDYNCDELRLGGSNILSCNITNALNQAYEAGMQPRQTFNVVFTGIKDEDNEKFGGNGTMMITFGAPEQQARMVSATANGTSIDGGYTFWSFFDPEEEDGRFVFEFTDDLASNGGDSFSATLSMGNLDQIAEGRYYSENLDYTIDGNKIIVETRGKLRSLARMFPSVDFAAEAEGEQDERFIIDTEHINLAIKNIEDKNGNFVFSPGQGTTGSFTYTFQYKEIEDDISMDGDRPEDREGQPKQEGSKVQLWVDQELKSVDGVLLYVKVDNNQGVDEEGNQIYGTGQVAISKNDIKILSSDPDEGTVLGFNLPASLNVTVTDGSSSEGATMTCSPVVGQPIRLVLQVTTTNGMPHDLVINYGYKEEIATAISEVPALNTQNTAVYNLAGQRVNANTKGIVIINNKKVINK